MNVDKFIETVAELRTVTEAQVTEIKVSPLVYYQLEHKANMMNETKPQDFNSLEVVRGFHNPISSPLLTLFGIKIIKGER